MPRGSSKNNKRFGETHRFHLQGNKTVGLHSPHREYASRWEAKRSLLQRHLRSRWKTKSLLTLKMEAICSSETSVLLSRATRHHISEDSLLHCHPVAMSQKTTSYIVIPLRYPRRQPPTLSPRDDIPEDSLLYCHPVKISQRQPPILSPREDIPEDSLLHCHPVKISQKTAS
jgi:hypothetical protein